MSKWTKEKKEEALTTLRAIFRQCAAFRGEHFKFDDPGKSAFPIFSVHGLGNRQVTLSDLESLHISASALTNTDGLLGAASVNSRDKIMSFLESLEVCIKPNAKFKNGDVEFLGIMPHSDFEYLLNIPSDVKGDRFDKASFIRDAKENRKMTPMNFEDLVKDVLKLYDILERDPQTVIFQRIKEIYTGEKPPASKGKAPVFG